MKITKRQLKRIISEEFAATPAEAGELYVNLSPAQEQALTDLETALDACINSGVNEADMQDTFTSKIEGR